MKNLITGMLLLLFLTVITGFVYPFAIYLIGDQFWGKKANGSLIMRGDTIVGSEILGQKFSSPEYFWGRPSAIDNNPTPSGGSNLNPIGNKFKEIFSSRVDTIRKYHGNIPVEEIPKDLLFASGSGVDPHISAAAAYFQIDRVSRFRHLNESQKLNLKATIDSSIDKRDLFVLGEERVNVLELNMKLSELKQ